MCTPGACVRETAEMGRFAEPPMLKTNRCRRFLAIEVFVVSAPSGLVVEIHLLSLLLLALALGFLFCPLSRGLEGGHIMLERRRRLVQVDRSHRHRLPHGVENLVGVELITHQQTRLRTCRSSRKGLCSRSNWQPK